jgi:hypothetical protein
VVQKARDLRVNILTEENIVKPEPDNTQESHVNSVQQLLDRHNEGVDKNQTVSDVADVVDELE